jgi:hypothetical protein
MKVVRKMDIEDIGSNLASKFIKITWKIVKGIFGVIKKFKNAK